MNLRLLRQRVVSILLASACDPGLCTEQVSAPLPVRAVLERETLLSAAFSADARWIAVVVMRVGSDPASGSPADVMTTTLSVMEVATGRWLQPAPSGFQTHTFAWSPAGATLVFDVQSGHDHHLWTWTARNLSARPLGTVEVRSGNLLWAKDGQAVVAPVMPASASASALALEERTANRLEPSVVTSSSGASVTIYRSEPEQQSAALIRDAAFNHRFRAGLARIDTQTGALRWLARDTVVQSLHISPDGRWIAYTRLTGQVQGNGYRNLFDLLVVPVNGGAPPHPVVSGIESISTVLDFSWSPDSRRLAFIARTLRQNGDPGVDNDCYWVESKGGERRRIRLIDPGDERGFAVSVYRTPLWSGGDAMYLLGTRGLWRADLRTSNARLITSIPGQRILGVVAPRFEQSLVLSDSRRNLIVIARDDSTKAEGFFRIDVWQRTAKRLLEANAHFGSSPKTVDVSADGRLVLFSRESADRSEQLWLADADLRTPRQLTNLTPQLSAHPLGRARLITWTSADGTRHQGSLLLPADYRPGQRYPLITQLFGEEHASDSLNRFGGVNGVTLPYYNSQLLASRGFAVLEPDTPTNSATLMHDIAASILPGIDATIDIGVADPNRLGLRGQSAGGYQALALLVQTSRFKAAAITAGFADLFGMYSQMHADGTHWAMFWVEDADRMAGSPWEYRQRYIDNSPYFFLDRVHTAVLLMHGVDDTAVQPELADQIFVSLRRLGKEVEYAKYANEGHVFLRRPNAEDAAERMIRWFQRHLGKCPETAGAVRRCSESSSLK